MNLPALRVPVLLAAGLLCLVACGGGGGGSTPPPPPPPPSPVAQTITFAIAGPVDKNVGDATFTNAASGGAGTGAITYSSGTTTVATVAASTGTVTVLAAGSTMITASKAASDGFLAATATYTLNVLSPPPLAQTIGFANPGPLARTVGDAPFINAASGGAGAGAITYSSNNTSVATVGAATGQVTVIAVGTAVITANKAASTGYLAATASYTLNVGTSPATQTIAFDTPGPIAKTYGDTPFANWASNGSGTGAITYASDTTAVATVNATSGFVTIIGAGTAIITATKAASPGYLPASASYTLNVARAAQTIAFVYPGPLSKRPYDNDFTNPAGGGGGDGEIEYTSSDTSAAMVNGPRGEIHVVGVGTTTITANKAQSANHLAASAAYVINVYTRPMGPMHAWITYDESVVQFPAGAVGADWLRSSLQGCSFNNFESCPLAPVSSLYIPNVNDTETEIFGVGVYALRRNGFTTRPTVIDGFGYHPHYDNEVIEENGTLWSLNFNQALIDRSNDGRAWTASSAPMPYGPREGAAAVGFSNKIWVIGGNQLQVTDPGTTVGEQADVYQIDTRGGSGFVTHAAGYGARKYHRVVSFDGRMWLIGGMRGTPAQYLNDIWSSTDGITWTRVTAAAPFAPRAEHSLTVFQGRLWLIAGRNSTGYLDDVWSSFDGVTWQLESHFGNYGRAGHRTIVNNSRMYVIGRAEYVDYFAYSTVDGVSWQHHDSLDVPSWVTRFAATSFRNRLWMFGGTDNLSGGCCARGEVWSSTDAETWRFESLGAPFSSMPGAKMLAFNNELYLTSSSTHVNHQYQRPWKTSDVIDWTATGDASWPLARSHQVMLTHNNQLFLIGGRNLQPGTFNGSRSDVYSTADGVAWSRNTAHAFLERYGHSGYVINGRMFVLGGWEDTPTQLGDIHSSADGTNWRTDVATSTNIGLRSYHETVTFNNRVWLLGGQKNGTGVTSEIWSSADGITWQLEKANEPATARMQFGAVVFFSRLWIVGGKDAAGNLLSDVWSSADGVTWRLESPAVLPYPRAQLALAVFDNRLYLFGGESTDPADAGRGINEMWMSANGTRWFRLYRNEMEIP